jgi:hypothetical protein
MASETNSLSKVRFGVTNRINRDDDDGGESMEERLWILLGFDGHGKRWKRDRHGHSSHCPLFSHAYDDPSSGIYSKLGDYWFIPS